MISVAHDGIQQSNQTYAGLLKQHGSVVDGRKAQAQTQAKGARPKSLGSSPPTVTRKVASDLGISHEAVRNRIKALVLGAAKSFRALAHQGASRCG
jgi:hypothetical protein